MRAKQIVQIVLCTVNIIDLIYTQLVILVLNQDLFRVWFGYVEILRRSHLIILIKTVKHIL